MKIFRNIFLLLLAIPLFIILVWLFAVPDNLLREKIVESISGKERGNLSGTIKGFEKGLFFSAYADALEVSIDGSPALTITGLEGSFNIPRLLEGKVSLSIKGKIGTGDITGRLTYPADAEIHVDRADFNAIPYLSTLGIKSNGYISGDISIKGPEAHITFKIPDLAITEAHSIIPFIETFHKTQGVLSVTQGSVKVESIGLEGEKGYARLKGDITNRVMDLNLELMPEADKLTSLESMLIGKYVVSPGYYVIPVKGNLL